MALQKLVDGVVIDMTPEEETQFLADQALTQPSAAQIARKTSLLADAGRTDLLTRLQTATSTQIDNWIDNNVLTLADARTVLKAVVKVLARIS